MTRQKIEWPNFTITPNRILAELRFMKEAELKVTLMICRVTFGYQNPGKKRLTVTELQALTLLSRPSVIAGCGDGFRRGTLEREPRGNSYAYGLNMTAEEDETVKILSSSAKEKQAKIFTAEHPETVKNINSLILNKDQNKKTPQTSPPNPPPKPPAKHRSRYALEVEAAAPQEVEAANYLINRWREIFSREDDLVTDKRRLIAIARLRDGKTREQLEAALLGLFHSDWHQKRGKHRDRQGAAYSGFEWLMNTVERVEDFIDRERQHKAAEASTGKEATNGDGKDGSPGGGGRGRRNSGVSKRDGDATQWRGYSELEKD